MYDGCEVLQRLIDEVAAFPVRHGRPPTVIRMPAAMPGALVQLYGRVEMVQRFGTVLDNLASVATLQERGLLGCRVEVEYGPFAPGSPRLTDFVVA